MAVDCVLSGGGGGSCPGEECVAGLRREVRGGVWPGDMVSARWRPSCGGGREGRRRLAGKMVDR